MKNFFLRKLITYGSFILILSIITLIYTLLIHYQKIDPTAKSYSNTTFVIGIIVFFILGLISGKVADKNGLLEGLIAALFIILISLIVNLFVKVNFEANSFVKMGTYLLASGLGGIIGVNLNNRKGKK